jgi:hypothetical protein
MAVYDRKMVTELVSVSVSNMQGLLILIDTTKDIIKNSPGHRILSR